MKPICRAETKWIIWRPERWIILRGFPKWAKRLMRRARRRYYKNVSQMISYYNEM